MERTDVLIAGGGPVGLVLAHTLAFYGISSILVERNPTTTRYPKMDLTNGRSVELLARLGLKEVLDDVAVDADHPLDVAWVTSMAGHELCRFPYPSVAEMRRLIRETNDGSMPAQPQARVSQILLEPALRQALEKRPQACVRYGWSLKDFEQDATGVDCVVEDQETGERRTIRAKYLAGCDGGGSMVRKKLGIALEGDPAMRTSYMIHFRSSACELLQRWGIAWHYQSNRCTLVAQDDRENWTLHTRIPPGVDPTTVDPGELLENFVGARIPHEVLLAEPWQAHLVVAERFSEGRVFLAGDSSHQFVPTGGYGMNTGVADAVDLGWKLAATLEGWGGPELLASFDAERRPTALRNREAARANVAIRFQIDDLYMAAGDIVSETAEADANRAALSAKLKTIGNPENERRGIEFGYVYPQSPIIVAENDLPAPDSSIEYVPSLRAGARLPSSVLEDGPNIYDLLGPWFTLLAFGGQDLSEGIKAAEALAIPLKTLAINDPHLAEVYKGLCFIVRPDHHIAWSGSQLPAKCGPLLSTIAGHGRSAPATCGSPALREGQS